MVSRFARGAPFPPVSSKAAAAGLAALLLLAIGAEQWWSARAMGTNVGRWAYSVNYALRVLGEEGDFVGRVRDFKWNALPDRADDVRGFQPRYLIAREVLPGVTEAQWWCAYLVEAATRPPAEFYPSPFPGMRVSGGAAP